MSLLRVSEIYPTIQGEGRFTGAPAMFVRLQGCDVGCPWCDTKHTWDRDADVLVELEDRYLASYLQSHYAAKPGVHHVVITGGEPASYDLLRGTTNLCGSGYRTAIETSGTYELRVHEDVWVTVSPKWNMPGGRKVLDSVLYRANELKCVVGKAEDVEAALAAWSTAHRARGVQLYLQPLSQSPKATKLCIDACLETGAHLSAQTHKYLQLP